MLKYLKIIRAEIILKGKVQMVGFRTFIKNSADSLNKSFDVKAEKMVAVLSAMNEKLVSIDEKQDKRVEIVDTVKQDTGEMTDTLFFLKEVR